MADKLTMSSQAVVDENGVSTLAYLRDDDAIHPGQDSGTTMVNFTDDDLDEGITDYPSFVSKVISGITLKKFLRDFVEGAGYVLHRGNIANNLTTTEVGSLLDATQGKVLNDNKLDKTGDAQNATVGTFTESSASYPVPTAGDTFKVALGKIVKFFADIKTNALSGLSVSGRVITYTKADGATGTITTQDTTYEVATSNSNGLMSSTMVSKLATIEEGANNYTLPTATDEVIGGVSVTEGNGLTNTDGNIAVSAASSTSAGTITSTEYTKLTGIESGAEVNQNAFSNVAVGNTTIASGAKTATLTLTAGSNVSLSPDANAKKVTISATDTTYGLASTSANGLLRQLPSSNSTTQYLRGDGNWTTVVNNATTSDSGYVLDARMGKTLQDQITTLNDSLTYKSGDTLTIRSSANMVYGFSNFAGTSLFCHLPLSKPMRGASIQVLTDSVTDFYIRNANGVETVSMSRITAINNIVEEPSGLRFNMQLSSAITSPKNAILYISIDLRVTAL